MSSDNISVFPDEGTGNIMALPRGGALKSLDQLLPSLRGVDAQEHVNAIWFEFEATKTA